MTYLFFDLETSGLPIDYNAPPNDLDNWPRIIQIAWQIFDENKTLISEKCYIVKPIGFFIEKESFDLHGISHEKASKEGREIKIVLEQINNDLKDVDIIVCHNIKFDVNVLASELLRNNFSDLVSSKQSICTMVESTEFCQLHADLGGKWPKLIELYSTLFNEDFEEHDALRDVQATSRCFWKLLELNVINPHLSIGKQQIEYSGFYKIPLSKSSKEIHEKILKKYNKSNFSEIAIAAKSQAINFLGNKFSCIREENIIQEFFYLKNFYSKLETKGNNCGTEIQESFLFEIKKMILMEHLDSTYIFSDKNVSLKKKLRSFDTLSIFNVNDSEEFRNLVIMLYYYYLSLYESFLPKETQEELHSIDNTFSPVTKSLFYKYELGVKLCEILILGGEEFIYEKAKDELLSVEESFDKLWVEKLIESFNNLYYVLDSGTNKKLKAPFTKQEFYSMISVQALYNIDDLEDDFSLKIKNISGVDYQKFRNSNEENYFENFKIEISKINESFELNSLMHDLTYIYQLRIKSIDYYNRLIDEKEVEGCYIATCIYKDYNHPNVLVLRVFRDNYLSSSIFGALFIKFYYKLSPALVKLCNNKITLNKAGEISLNFLISTLKKRLI